VPESNLCKQTSTATKQILIRSIAWLKAWIFKFKNLPETIL